MAYSSTTCLRILSAAVIVISAWNMFCALNNDLTAAKTNKLYDNSLTKVQSTSSSRFDRVVNATGYPIPPVEVESLPTWIQSYIQWHQESRMRFPGDALLKDPAAPKLLIRTCSASFPCGGLHDRLGKLPWDLYLANQTGRLLLFHWCKPAPLQEFLIPRTLDWTLPVASGDQFDMAACTGQVNRMKDFFRSFKSTRPRASFWEKDFNAALVRAKPGGNFEEARVLRSNILGDDLHLRELLTKSGEADMLDWTSTSFGKLFWALFQPSPGLQSELDKVYQHLQLHPGNYSAVHCRVRHPKATAIGKLLEAKNKDGGPDKAGLLWDGDSRQFAIETANRAIQCATTSQAYSEEPLYFYADSEDLVRHYVQELIDPPYLSNHPASNPSESKARQLVQDHRILGRPITSETLHIDRQTGFPASAYYDSFVDLLVAARARCVAVGVGNFALFAAKLTLSGRPCVIQYQGEAWGNEGVKQQFARQCELAFNSTT